MSEPTPIVDVYWRPGCMYCRNLRVALNEAGVPAAWHNIHDDPDAAAFVRSVAHGNETVPTVAFDDQVQVAPRPVRLLDDLRAANPESAVGHYRRWAPLRIVQWIGIIALIVLGAIVASGGQDALSWAFDGAAVGWYLLFRYLRGRTRY